MKQIKSNVKYCIERKMHYHDADSDWEQIRCHKNLQDAMYDIEQERKEFYKQEFRLTRVESIVIN
jgi:hypothetical protein